MIGIYKITSPSGRVEASRGLNIYQGDISKCCLGKIPSAGGYVWKYKNITE